MSDQTQGELLYEYTVQFTQVVEYGVSMEALTSGQAAPPPEGARFDVYWLFGNERGLPAHPTECLQ